MIKLKTLIELYKDARNIMKKDPASRNVLEVIILYPGFHILVFHIFYININYYSWLD